MNQSDAHARVMCSECNCTKKKKKKKEKEKKKKKKKKKEKCTRATTVFWKSIMLSVNNKVND